MSDVLGAWNDLPAEEAAEEILVCCGSKAWAEKMAAQRPIVDEGALLAANEVACKSLTESDWSEAFRSHPRIGETGAQAAATSQCSVAWSREEQGNVAVEDDDIKMKMVEGNRDYERRFRRTFIICATGKSASDISQNLKRRLANDDATEFHEACKQQRQIAHLRLKKWLA
jgi:2-oxo-4-hydroxy-4-carboxy-5-ureidoimidazoline decarboxylase